MNKNKNKNINFKIFVIFLMVLAFLINGVFITMISIPNQFGDDEILAKIKKLTEENRVLENKIIQADSLLSILSEKRKDYSTNPKVLYLHAPDTVAKLP